MGFRLKRVSPLLLGLLFGFMQMAGTALAGDPGSYVPGPTPKPYPLLYCAEPAYTYGTQGMNGRIWTGRFLQYCEANGIPADTRGFEQIGEHETYGRQYRLMVGGAALYVQLRDDVLVSFLLEMDDEAMTTRQMEETLLHYYPLVMRACVYASLQGAGTGEAEAVVSALCQALETIYTAGLSVDNRVSYQGIGFCFIAEPVRMWQLVSFTGEWEE